LQTRLRIGAPVTLLPQTVDRYVLAVNYVGVTRPVDLQLHNHELSSEDGVKALVKEIEERLLPLVQSDMRARIL
jgi:hypothetical protein